MALVRDVWPHSPTECSLSHPPETEGRERRTPGQRAVLPGANGLAGRLGGSRSWAAAVPSVKPDMPGEQLGPLLCVQSGGAVRRSGDAANLGLLLLRPLSPSVCSLEQQCACGCVSDVRSVLSSAG